jgi:hypothetical protein
VVSQPTDLKAVAGGAVATLALTAVALGLCLSSCWLWYLVRSIAGLASYLSGYAGCLVAVLVVFAVLAVLAWFMQRKKS